ncbi:hypothetical protein ZHAS_00018742 [Anopheles sinensis]|uniref:Uncharacterized protein n=1 Tax=Anopheles sinensis TaxID=74873 RepID=A0A084WKF8_ANOSI|nr:hypothetical protein ZHAS_00018742 [Anopheles sinensis]
MAAVTNTSLENGCKRYTYTRATHKTCPRGGRLLGDENDGTDGNVEKGGGSSAMAMLQCESRPSTRTVNRRDGDSTRALDEEKKGELASPRKGNSAGKLA